MKGDANDAVKISQQGEELIAAAIKSVGENDFEAAPQQPDTAKTCRACHDVYKPLKNKVTYAPMPAPLACRRRSVVTGGSPESTRLSGNQDHQIINAIVRCAMTNAIGEIPGQIFLRWLRGNLYGLDWTEWNP